MQSLISVIVPIYKVEQYLPRCLDSLCRQSLKNIEILLINDASPDRCSEICEDFAEKDTRIKIFHHTENKGPSAARNTGIQQAVSDYLMFVDSDDWVHEDFCKIAYECAVEYHADLVMFGFENIGYSNFIKDNRMDERFIQSGYKTRLEAIDLLDNGVGQTAWNKLYDKKLFKDISYPLGYVYEDIGTTYKIIWQTSNIYYTNKVLYYHCYHDGSINTLKNEKALHDWIEMNLQKYRDLKEWGYPSEKLDIILKNIAFKYCMKKKADVTDENYVYCANILCNSPDIPACFSWRKKVMFVLFKYCRQLFELICICFGRKWTRVSGKDV